MRVYVVTSGSYSEYHIEEIFTDHKKAQIYANLNSDRSIEEYDTDQVDFDSVENSERRFIIWYEIEEDRIADIEQTSYDLPAELQEIYTSPRFRFCVNASLQLFEEIKAHGTNGPILKKVAQDTLAEFLYQKGTSREEYIRQYRKEHTEPRQPYVNSSTSSSIDYPLGLMSMLWEQMEKENDDNGSD